MNKLDEEIKNIAKQVVESFIEKGLTLSTAESCTGGAIAAAITAIPGASQMFNGAVVAYSNAIKSGVLGVDTTVLESFGAVSNETVLAMATGVRRLMHSDVSIATSGIAGPTGGSQEKPVGLVYFSIVDEREGSFDFAMLEGDRESVQKRSVIYILNTLYLSFC